MPPPVTCTKAFARPRRRARDVEVEPRRCEQVVAVVVLLLEHAPDEREAVGVQAGRREADDDVARLDRRTGQRLVDDADAGAGEVELALGVDARQLGRLAADERDAGLAADGGRAFDELRHLVEVDRVRRHVVEEHQRLGAAGGDVVDAVRGEVGAAVAQPAALPREDQLRADAVGGGGEKSAVAERMQARERAEALRAGRLDCRAQPVDDRPGRRERDPGGRVALLRHAKRSPYSSGRPSGPPSTNRTTAPPTFDRLSCASRPRRSASAPAFTSGSSARSWSSASCSSSLFSSSSSIQSRGG